MFEANALSGSLNLTLSARGHLPGMRMATAACTALRMMLSIANIQWGLIKWFLKILLT